MNEAEDRAQAQRIGAGKALFHYPVTFVKGVVGMEHLPPMDRREVAFAGRSNVGKSSLINAVCRNKSLARTSGDPGRTRELNFFALHDNAGYLVDLPGYGFAKAPKPVVQRWVRLTDAYLRGRANLARVFLLIDARHGIKDNDAAVMSALDAAAVSYCVVLTKIDKLKKAEADALPLAIAGEIRKRPAAFPRVGATSSSKSLGIDLLRGEIAEALQG